MLRIRTAALSLAATGAAALALGLTAGPAVAHDFGHHGFFGHHHRHGLTGVVQSVDTSAHTAVVALEGMGRSMHRAWDHGSSSGSSSRQVTLDLSSASIFDGSAWQRHCHGPNSESTASTMSLSSVQAGDVVSFALAVDHDTARQDLASGTAVPVSKLIDWGQPSSGAQPQNGSDVRRFAKHA